jgi:hypothetical protein
VSLRKMPKEKNPIDVRLDPALSGTPTKFHRRESHRTLRDISQQRPSDLISGTQKMLRIRHLEKLASRPTGKSDSSHLQAQENEIFSISFLIENESYFRLV